MTIISNTIHELDAFILTQEDANALTTAAADKVRLSLEERLNIIDTELAKASSASSAAQDLISDNLAAVSGKVDDSLQALDCLSDKITAMSEYIDDEMTTAKIDTARLSDDLKTMSYKLDAGVATVKLEAVQFQCQIEDHMWGLDNKWAHLIDGARQNLDSSMASNKAELSREYTLVRQQLIEVNEDVIVNQACLKKQNEDIGALRSQERLVDNRVGALEEGPPAAQDNMAKGIQKLVEEFPIFFTEHDLKEIEESPEDVAKVVLKGFMRQMGQMDMRLTAQIHSRKAAFGKAEDGSAFPHGPPAIFPPFIGPQQPEPLHSPYDQHPYQARFQVQAQAGSPSQFNVPHQPPAFIQRSGSVAFAGPELQSVPASQGYASPALRASWVKAKEFRPSSTPPVAVSIPVASTPAATSVASPAPVGDHMTPAVQSSMPPFTRLLAVPLGQNKVLRTAEAQAATRKTVQNHQATVEATRKLEVTEQEIAAMNEKIAVKNAKRATEELVRQTVKERPENSE